MHGLIVALRFFRDVLGQQVLLNWWHGKGGLIDYTNKAALQWWHSQMDQVKSKIYSNRTLR